MTEAQIKQETHLFVEKILETDVYKAYVAARDEIKKNEPLYQQVNDFRRENFDIQNNTAEEHMMDAVEAFEAKYEDFRANPLVDHFLSAELAFCRMMQEITLQITDEVDFEL